MRHGGSVMAPDAVLAVHYAREMFSRRQESVRLWVVRRADIHDSRRPGPAPAAARSLVQEARRLRDARQARRRPRAVRPGEAEGARRQVTTIRSDPRDRRAGPALRDALDGLLLSMADDEFVIGFSDSEWTGIAPMLEEDVAMSSLAQDELGHAQALYQLLAAAARRRPRRRRDRLRPVARRVPPRPAPRPRPRRLGDDDRPAVPLRHRRHRPGSTRSPRQLVRPAARARRQDPARGALPRHARDGLVRAPGRARWRAPQPACWPRSRSSGADAATVFTPLDGEDAPRRGRRARRADERALEARWRATITPTFVAHGLPMPPAAADAAGGRTRPRRAVPLAVGRVHDASAVATRSRHGDRRPPAPRLHADVIAGRPRRGRRTRRSRSHLDRRSRDRRSRGDSSRRPDRRRTPADVHRVPGPRGRSRAAVSGAARRRSAGRSTWRSRGAVPWTSDRITRRRATVASGPGFAPPAEPEDVRCPCCDSAAWRWTAPSARPSAARCFYCRACRQPFEAFKPI